MILIQFRSIFVYFKQQSYQILKINTILYTDAHIAIQHLKNITRLTINRMYYVLHPPRFLISLFPHPLLVIYYTLKAVDISIKPHQANYKLNSEHDAHTATSLF